MQQTLRALPDFQGKPALDYVKMDVDMDGQHRSHFARCACFFVDSQNTHFIAVRWLTEVPGVVIDGTALFPPLTLSPPGNIKSYSVMPATSIQNGAIVLAAGRKLWPLLSPRVEKAYIISNNHNAAQQDSTVKATFCHPLVIVNVHKRTIL